MNRFLVFAALLVAIVPLSAAAQSETDVSDSAESSARLALTGEVLVPVTEEAGFSRLGYGVGVGSWNKTGQFFFNPRLAFHYGPGSGGAYFLNVAVDLGLYIAPLEGMVMPFAGVGAGFRYLRTRGPSNITTSGTIVRATFDSAAATSYLGVAGFVRIGAILAFGPSLRPIISVDYIGVRFNDLGSPDSVIVSVGVAL